MCHLQPQHVRGWGPESQAATLLHMLFGGSEVAECSTKMGLSQEAVCSIQNSGEGLSRFDPSIASMNRYALHTKLVTITQDLDFDSASHLK